MSPLTIATSLDAEPAPVPVDERPLTLLSPPRGWQMVNVSELWRFRELLFYLTWRDVKVRYKQTALGAAWAILQPAALMVAFAMFFGSMANVSTGPLAYKVFVYAGLLPWSFFASSVTNSSNSVVSSERLVSKIYFPRLAIPFAAVGAAAVDFCIAMLLLIALMAWYRIVPSINILLAPLFLAIITLTALGVGTFVSALTVSYRDFRYVIPFAVQFWMLATPTIYRSDIATGRMKLLYAVNPMTGLIEAFRAACLGGTIHWSAVAASAACGVVCFVGGCLYFRRMEETFADII